MLCLKAHAKINWTLDILGTRKDGYHLMDMLMQAVDLHDVLTLEEADDLTLEGETVVDSARAADDGLSSARVTYDRNNLVYKAAQALRTHCGVQRGAHMTLQKHIPSGAGMGGGSADAAAAMHGLNRLWGLGLTLDQLRAIGVTLGADIPFMLTGGLARVQGIGEAITPLSPAPRMWLVLLQPCGGLSTREVFTAFDAMDPAQLCRPDNTAAQAALLTGDVTALGAAMNNVLEGVSVNARPALRHAMDALEAGGAVRAMMTGSGSVVYGVYRSESDALRSLAIMHEYAQAHGLHAPWMTHTI